MKTVRIAALVAVTVAMAACSRRQPPAQPDAQPTPPPVQTQPAPQPSMPPAADSDAERVAEARRIAAILGQTVYFDYDESSIRADAQALLAAKVPVLRANTAIRIVVEGHADERGSVEYNLALGMRRANAVRDYLTGFGIDAARIQVRSLGEDQPAVGGSSESAWSQNRRAEFRVSAGLN